MGARICWTGDLAVAHSRGLVLSMSCYCRAVSMHPEVSEHALAVCERMRRRRLDKKMRVPYPDMREDRAQHKSEDTPDSPDCVEKQWIECGFPAARQR